MGMAERTWAEVGQLVKKARETNGMTQEDMAAAANAAMGTQVLSSANLRVFEAGGRESYRTRTLVGIARALGWVDDAVERLLAGEEPSVLLANGGARLDQVRDRLRSEVLEETPDPNLASADGVDLERLAELDPEGYAAVIAQARLLLRRAEERAE